MKMPSFIKSFSIFETILLIGFVFYFIFPVPMSFDLAHMVISPWSFLVYFVITMYLFFYSHPVLAVVYVFFVYEMLSRSQTAIKQHLNIESVPNVKSVFKQSYTNKSVKDISMKHKAAPQQEEVTTGEVPNSLEAEMVNQMSPVGVGVQVSYEQSEYKPVSEDIGSASLY